MVVDTLISAKTASSHSPTANQTTRSQEALAYFYCNKNEPERCDPASILRSIVKQLSSLEPGSDLLRPVVSKYEEEEKANFPSGPLDLGECSALIVKLIASYSQTNIIIDALDECDKGTRSGLISVLAGLLKPTRSLVKIFVSSRDDNDIFARLSELPNLRISAADNAGDIDRFVRSEVERRITNRELLRGEVSNDLKTHVVETLIKGADGM